MGASTQAKSFMQMEKELRAKIDGMSDDDKTNYIGTIATGS